MIAGVSWEAYLGLDPPFEQIAIRAKAVIREDMPNAGAAASARAAVSAGAAAAAASAGEPPSRFFYVGLTRYLRERWYGSEHIPPKPRPLQYLGVPCMCWAIIR